MNSIFKNIYYGMRSAEPHMNVPHKLNEFIDKVDIREIWYNNNIILNTAWVGFGADYRKFLQKNNWEMSFHNFSGVKIAQTGITN